MGSSRPTIRGLASPSIRISVLFVILLCFLALGFLGQAQTANPPGNAVRGDCRRAQVDAAPFLFLVSTPKGLPAVNVTITVNGVSKLTNSSGIATFSAVDIMTFEVGAAGTNSLESLVGYTSPILCLGDSYYHVVSMVTNVTYGIGS